MTLVTTSVGGGGAEKAELPLLAAIVSAVTVFSAIDATVFAHSFYFLCKQHSRKAITFQLSFRRACCFHDDSYDWADPSAGPGHPLRDRQVELLLELVAVRAAPSTMPNRRLSALVDRIFDETQESQQHIRFCQALDTLVHVVFEMSRSEAADGQLPADHPRARSRSRSPRDNG